MMKKSNTLIKYIIEGSIVFLSVFLSFYITDVNREKNMKERKNILLKDLSNSMIQDTLQIYSYIAEKEIILKSWSLIRDDIDSNHKILSDDEFFNEYQKGQIGRTFMSRNGIFNQMISTGNIELIENYKLKNNLIEIFNHLRARNESTTNLIDRRVFLVNQPLIDDKFRIKRNLYGEKALTASNKIESYNFNKSFYLSNRFYEMINNSLGYTYYYKALLEEMLTIYRESIILIDLEIKK